MHDTDKKKYVIITIAILVAPYVAVIFFASNSIRDVHEVRGHEFVLLYEGMPRGTDDGLLIH